MTDYSMRRREFVSGAAAVATGLAINADALATGHNSIYQMTHAKFSTLIGQSFSVQGVSENGTPQRGTLVLKDVVRHSPKQASDRPSQVRSESFSLMFETHNSALATGTHQVSGAGFEQQGLFLQEMLDERHPGRRHYEAIFN